jgi:hypothetical protein
VPWEKLEGDYPHYPDILDNKPDQFSRNRVIDLRPYINTSPATIHESASVRKAYTMFRGIGLRHLCVIDHEHVCVGLITRHDLLEHHIEHIAHQHEEAAAKYDANAAVEAAAAQANVPPGPTTPGSKSRSRIISRKESGASIVSGASFRFGGFPASPFLVEAGREETLSVCSSGSHPITRQDEAKVTQQLLRSRLGGNKNGLGPKHAHTWGPGDAAANAAALHDRRAKALETIPAASTPTQGTPVTTPVVARKDVKGNKESTV